MHQSTNSDDDGITLVTARIEITEERFPGRLSLWWHLEGQYRYGRES